MLWLQEKYINLISHRLPLFKKVRQNQYAFRCVICHDSKTNKYKTRGGLYVHSGAQEYNYGCFNCGASMKFTTFLKQFDPSMYDEYQLEAFKESQTDFSYQKKEEPKAVQKKNKIDMSALTRIDHFDEDHLVMKYILSRKIPKNQWKKLYFCPKYLEWISLYTKKKYNKAAEHPRLIIPFFDRYGNITRISARAFGNESPKYLYTVINKESTRLYGIDSIDTKKPVYVVEGPLDSLFIENSIAVGMASYEDPELNNIPDKVFIPDNEPRNKDVCENFRKVVERGEKVCIWQEDTEKDINDMIKNGKSIESIMRLIRESTFSGIEAKLKFSEWIKY
jgi:hypothetical protein